MLVRPKFLHIISYHILYHIITNLLGRPSTGAQQRLTKCC